LTLYAESSAVLAWVFREAPAAAVKELLEDAEIVFASSLTVVECHRALVRSQAIGHLSEFEAGQRRGFLESALDAWALLDLEPAILGRARRRFPGEPLRTLDALHLASALAAKVGIPDLALLSLDSRVRASGEALGFDVYPR
jgi:predicted nucleic acid-binding protein